MTPIAFQLAAAVAIVAPSTLPSQKADSGRPRYALSLSTLQERPEISPARYHTRVRSLVKHEQPPKIWNVKCQRRFEKLLTLKIAKKIDAEEMAEFDRLKVWRRQLLDPQTPDQVLREYREAKMADALLSGLKKYVEFIGRQN